MKYRGFTLIEILVVIAIIGILVSLAYPSYSYYLQASRRAEGKTALMDLAGRMEQYFTVNNTYANATLADLGVPTTSPSGFYTLEITTATASSYIVQAMPAGIQTEDTLCGTYTLDQLGRKGLTGIGNIASCW